MSDSRRTPTVVLELSSAACAVAGVALLAVADYLARGTPKFGIRPTTTETVIAIVLALASLAAFLVAYRLGKRVMSRRQPPSAWKKRLAVAAVVCLIVTAVVVRFLVL